MTKFVIKRNVSIQHLYSRTNTPTYQHFKNIYNKTVLIVYVTVLYFICFAGMLNQTKPTLKIHPTLHILVWLLCQSDFAYNNDTHFSSNNQFIKTSTAKIIEFFNYDTKVWNLKTFKRKAYPCTVYSAMIIYVMNILTK